MNGEGKGTPGDATETEPTEDDAMVNSQKRGKPIIQGVLLLVALILK